MDTMDTSANQQTPSSATHHYYAPISHYHFHGVGPHSINHGQPCKPSNLPLFQSRPQEPLSAAPEGAICIGNEVVFGPPKEGQVTRMIEVDGITTLWICDKELRKLYDHAHHDLNQRKTITGPLLEDPLLKSSTVLQYIFLSREPKSQHICEALLAAQGEVFLHLLEKVRSFKGKETELRDDMTPTGPGPMIRSFISYTLAYLQCFPAETLIKGRTEPVLTHFCEIRKRGIRFDLSSSFKPARSIEAMWEELPPLRDVGIWFDECLLPSTQWSGWFSAKPGRDSSLDPNIKKKGSLAEQDSPLGPKIKKEDSRAEQDSPLDPNIKEEDSRAEQDSPLDPNIKMEDSRAEQDSPLGPNIKEEDSLAEQDSPLGPNIKEEDSLAEQDSLGPNIKEEDSRAEQDSPLGPNIKEEGSLAEQDSPLGPNIKEEGSLAEQDSLDPNIKEEDSRAEQDSPLGPNIKEEDSRAEQDSPLGSNIKEEDSLAEQDSPLGPNIKEEDSLAEQDSLGPNIKEEDSRAEQDSPLGPNIKEEGSLAEQDSPLGPNIKEEGSLAEQDSLDPNIKEEDFLADGVLVERPETTLKLRWKGMNG